MRDESQVEVFPTSCVDPTALNGTNRLDAMPFFSSNLVRFSLPKIGDV
jgi:hypothetical protein